MKQSSGTLLYRQGARPRGPARPSVGRVQSRAPWGIPKGRSTARTPEEAARRETLEETGVIAGR